MTDACESDNGMIVEQSMFGDMSNKAVVLKWGKKIMVDVIKENPKTAIVSYGEVKRMKIHKAKNQFRRLTPKEVHAVIKEAMAFAQERASEAV